MQVTPTWKGFATLVKYRTKNNYRSGEFLGPRIGDKFIFTVLVATLYLGIGDDFEQDNVLNMAAVLFMWSTLPACAPLISPTWLGSADCAPDCPPAGPHCSRVPRCSTCLPAQQLHACHALT